MTYTEKIADRKRKRYALVITILVHVFLIGGLALQSSEQFQEFMPSLFNPEKVEVPAPRV